MGRMHAPGKGLSQSALPYRRSVPTWLKLTSDDVKEQIYKLAKKGLTPSQIGGCVRASRGPSRLPSCNLRGKPLAVKVPRTC
nr:40S ribosomal protein S13 [Vulpes vulpes]